MPIEIRVPDMGHDAKEAILVAWHKQPGDAVAIDEPIADVMTDKVNIEIGSPAAGTLREVRAAVDDTVAVGAVIAILEEISEEAK
jgi:pyruvate/2-oxoglutarate dehydrogenase complex dihydrolipoamide acyltransferase (E2) component